MGGTRYVAEFLCASCFEEWESEWILGDTLACPSCGTGFEAVWQINAAGNLIGPWVGRELGGGRQPRDELDAKSRD
jgi:hypothetical protein